MSNNGTASNEISDGSYIAFQTAILNQLPRPGELTKEALQLWVSAQGKLKNRLRDALLLIQNIDWSKAYNKLGMKAEYEACIKKMALPPTNPNLWMPLMLPGINCKRLVAAYHDLNIHVSTYTRDTDSQIVSNDRDPNKDGPYFSRFIRSIDADPDNRNLSAGTLAKTNHTGITLFERLFLGLGYYITTGHHLDSGATTTLCPGTRFSGDRVPCVGLSLESVVMIDFYHISWFCSNLRSRTVIPSSVYAPHDMHT